MSGVNANFSFGLVAPAGGTAAQTKSYAYDEAAYQVPLILPFMIDRSYPSGTATGTGNVAGNAVAFGPACNARQLKSISAIPKTNGTWTNINASVGDFFQIYLVSAYAQTFGTATGPSYFVGSNTSGTFYGSATNTGTNCNVVQIFNVMTFMTGQQGGIIQGAANIGYIGTGGLVAGTSGLTPQTISLSGGTFTIVVANSVGTTTQGGYVFPVGPTGGLSVNPGDVLIVQKGTDTGMLYFGELELSFTPGALVTR